MFDILLAVLHLIKSSVLSIVFCFVSRPQRKDPRHEVVLITGGAQGLGRLTAELFAKAGAVVVLWDVQESVNQTRMEMTEKYQTTVFSYVVDISDRNKVYQAAKQVKREVGTVTILVNNAGIVNGKPFLETDDNRIDLLMKVNTMAHFWTLKAFLGDMLQKGHGHVVTIASLAGLVAGSGSIVDYCASKFANVGMDEALKYELKANYGDKVKATVVCPYFTKTGMFVNTHADNWMFSMLEPEYVAQRIFEGILAEEEIVVIPKYGIIFSIIKYLFDMTGLLCVARALGAFNPMRDFKGSHAKSQ